MPLVSVLTKIEPVGVALHTPDPSRAIAILAARATASGSEIYDSVGHHFNLNSPKQLSSVLFEELNLGKTRNTTQGFSTDAASLDACAVLIRWSIAAGIPPAFKNQIDLSRLVAWLDRCGWTGPYVLQSVRSRDGRMSSSDPNLQNIPVRTQMGRNVRRAFVAQLDGNPALLLSADYSQIELRILAHISGEPQLVEAFFADEDIHSRRRRRFSREITEVTSDMRRLAKTINFATIYGLSAPGLAQRTDLSQREAADFIKAYFVSYPGNRTVSERHDSANQRTRVCRDPARPSPLPPRYQRQELQCSLGQRSAWRPTIRSKALTPTSSRSPWIGSRQSSKNGGFDLA